MHHPPTVRVKHGDDDYMVINASDFDSATHEVYEGSVPEFSEPEETVIERPATVFHPGAKIPTVKIWNETEDDYVVINQEDFDSAKHELYDGENVDGAAVEEEAAGHESTVSDFTVRELKPLIANCGDAETLKVMLDCETKSEKARAVVVRLIETRIEQLSKQTTDGQ